ncbi:VirB3 family type IV secretion system protein [Salmonella enterica]|nr:VirB3 family type IV secretion system protein [Salmonella enterica]
MEGPEQRRLTPFHRALHRPQQIMGGERELMLTSMLIAGGLMASALNLVGFIVGSVLWGACVMGLRKMAKADPVMSKVYIRQLKYAPYYAPFSRPYRVAKSPRIY